MSEVNIVWREVEGDDGKGVYDITDDRGECVGQIGQLPLTKGEPFVLRTQHGVVFRFASVNEAVDAARVIIPAIRGAGDYIRLTDDYIGMPNPDALAMQW